MKCPSDGYEMVTSKQLGTFYYCPRCGFEKEFKNNDSGK